METKQKDMDKDFIKLKEKVTKQLGTFIGGKPSFTMEYYPPSKEFGLDNGYYDFHELDEKGKSWFGFSSPDYKFFKESMLDYLKN